MINDTQTIAIIAVMALVTFALRVLPFLIFSDRKTPPYIVFLGQYLPSAIMGMLVIYCLKGVTFVAAPHGIPEAIAVLLVIILHVWKRNTLLSIISGTASYMLLLRFIG